MPLSSFRFSLVGLLKINIIFFFRAWLLATLYDFSGQKKKNILQKLLREIGYKNLYLLRLQGLAISA
jgi:hypothetical protein